ncbi:TAXI family TRAP transporter solute-binding subunit [uncultured Desulfosarcina sp.]|uniref:TAXI family TRAP transporter solute-binding subunit n=1 Tax=uncultured Desulfosarcina sp. TaxID=218289 RepID=UPI0029C81BA4|nr:TAXI family TRAP transporter solute-binding subunit [uncultured Desulfosarcina sp.]
MRRHFGLSSFVMLGVLIGVIGFVIPSPAAQKMLIGSTSASSSHYGYFVAVSQVINEKVAGLETSVVETGATVDNLRRFARKQIDLGLVTTNVLSQAYFGKKDFKGRPVQSKLLWVYVIAPQNAIVRKDAGISDLAELNGQRYNPGLKGSATEKTTEAVFEVLGIKPDYVRGSTTDIVTAVKDNHIKGYVKSGAGLKIDASSRDISTFTPIDILSLDKDQAALIQSKLPEVSIVEVPAGAGPGIASYTTWGFAVACSASLDMDEATAYNIVKAICEDKTVQASAMASVKGADFVGMTIKYATSPLHPGAIKYFKEMGAIIPDRLMEK